MVAGSGNTFLDEVESLRISHYIINRDEIFSCYKHVFRGRPEIVGEVPAFFDINQHRKCKLASVL
jgi:hypothetical protein